MVIYTLNFGRDFLSKYLAYGALHGSDIIRQLARYHDPIS